MYNILTDGLPKEYDGYLINYQFFNGILINDCLNDDEHLFDNTDSGRLEKIYTAFTILYGNGIPNDIDTAISGLNWFMSCGQDNEQDKKDSTRYFCFNQDSQYIYSAFRTKYNINLAKDTDLHWFEFIYLFNDLSKTAFREIVNIRMMKPNDMKNYSKEAKLEIQKQKEKFKLKNNNIEEYLTDEERKKVDDFYNLISGSTNNS